MLTLLKRIAGPLISYAQDPTYRRFIHFRGKARLTARYESRNIKLCGKPFRVVDMLSFAYQYEEIFCQETRSLGSAKYSLTNIPLSIKM